MKFIKLEQKLQLQTRPTTYTETSYWGTDITNDGVNIIINNAYDPNINDITVAYIDITEPVTADIDELTQVLRCWVLEGISAVKVFNSTPWILDADCNAIQNVSDILYWRGLPITGGGGGTVTGAQNGLNLNVTDVELGGDLIQNTDINTLDFRFKVEGTDPINGYNQGLSINANINQAQLFSATQNSILGWDSGLNRLQIQSGSLAGVTITNDGTNNIYFDPAGFTVNHNAFIQIQFNDTIDKLSTIAIDNVEAAFNYINTSTGAISQHSLNDSQWIASYQSANIASVQLNDNWVRTVYQNGANANVSIITAQDADVTIENTDGSDVATCLLSAQNGVRLTLSDNFTLDYNRMRILPSGISLEALVNGGNTSTLSVTPDIIFAEGGMGYSFISLVLSNTTLPSKKTLYFIDTTGANGTFTLTIPAENCIAGYVMTIKDETGNASNRVINIDTALGQMELGLVQTINTNFGYRTFVYNGSTWLETARG